MEDDEFNIYLEEADITTIHESYQFLIKVRIFLEGHKNGITLLPQIQLILARPYSPPDTARLRICTTLSWPAYSSFRINPTQPIPNLVQTYT